MATIKFIYRSDAENSEGIAPLYLRIYHNGKKRYKKTNIYLKKKHWDEKNQRIRKSHPEPTKINLDLNGLKEKARSAIRNASPLTAENIKHRFEGKNPDSFFRYMQKILPSFSYDNRKLIEAATTPLKKFAPRLTFSDINVTFLNEFHSYLKQDISHNSANAYVGVIRMILNRAIEDEIISPDGSPFVMKKYKMTWEDTDPTPLTWEQFVKIRDCEVPDRLQIHKDMFLFSVYMDGMRLTDVVTFETSTLKDGRTKYQMSKTKKQKQIKIVPAAKEIISRYGAGRYLFPLLDPDLKGDARKDEIRRITARIWHKVKELGERAGLSEHLHFHMARNTSAYIALTKGDWSLVEIQNMLGHSDIGQTRHYLGKMAPELLDDKRDDLWK